MKSYNWEQFTKRIPIYASQESIYQAWATQAGLEKWFLRKALFTAADKTTRERTALIQAGDSYEWLWFGYPDSMVEKNEIRVANGYDYLQFNFAGKCVVSISIKKENEETLCELSQSMSAAEENDRPSLYMECGSGWVFYLANLKSVLEGGIDLRNKNEAIRQVINA